MAMMKERMSQIKIKSNELGSTDRPHKNDDLRIQQVQEVRQDGFSSAQDKKRPGATTCKKPKIRTATGTESLERYKKSSHLVVPGTRAGSPETEEGKESFLFSASPETVSMICKLIECVNHRSILLAVTKYMDYLLERTLIEAQESNTAQGKLTPRETKSCAVPEAKDPLAEGGLLPCSNKETKRRGHVHPHTHERPPGDTPCSINKDIKHMEWEFPTLTTGKLPEMQGYPSQVENGQYMISKPRLHEVMQSHSVALSQTKKESAGRDAYLQVACERRGKTNPVDP